MCFPTHFRSYKATQENFSKFPDLMKPGAASYRHFFFLRDKDKLKNIFNYVCYVLFLLCLWKEEGDIMHQKNQVRHFLQF